MNHTTNLHLPQWEETDRIQMDDFNVAMERLDAAMPRIVTGTYTGTGEYGASHPNTLTFDFEPQFVLVHALGVGYSMLAVRPAAYAVSFSVTGPEQTYGCYLSWQGNTLSWYSDLRADRQCNSVIGEYIYYAVKF